MRLALQGESLILGAADPRVDSRQDQRIQQGHCLGWHYFGFVDQIPAMGGEQQGC